MTVKRIYNCSDETASEVCRRATANLKTPADLADFFAKSTNYTLAYVTMVEGLRTAWLALPNEEQRNATHEQARTELPGLLDPIKVNYRALQGYIRDAWPNSDPNPRYEAAGLTYYNSINKSNWEAVVTLQTMMLAFVNDPANTALLGTPGGMPPGFIAQLGTDYSPFETTYNLFAATIDTTTMAEAKITAMNKLVKEVKKFMKFGVETVYPKNDGQKDRYTWETIEQQVDPSQSGMLLKIMNGALDQPEGGVTCVWKPVGKPAVEFTNNADGSITEKELEAEKGTLTVKKVNFVDVNQEFELEPGVKKRVNITIQPV
jgi:hypothetical protein